MDLLVFTFSLFVLKKSISSVGFHLRLKSVNVLKVDRCALYPIVQLLAVSIGTLIFSCVSLIESKLDLLTRCFCGVLPQLRFKACSEEI